MSILKQIQHLYDQKLYTNVTRVAEIAITMSEQKQDSLSSIEKFQLMILYGNSLYKTKHFVMAESIYRQALQMRKSTKAKNTSNKIAETENEIINEAELKYRICLCCIALKQKNAAMEILRSINVRLRTPKINMALGNLFKEGGMTRSAITCYKDVLKECPLALEALENILKLGVKGAEANSLMIGMSTEVSWLNLWLKAQAQLNSKDFENALNTFKSMDTHGFLKDNPSLLVNMGYCYHYMCEDNKAIAVLQRALHLEPNLIFGRDLLSTLLAASGMKEDIHYLEGICPSTDTSLWTSEHWVVLGNYMLATKKMEKAAFFGQQACMLNPTNVEALLLKAKTLLQIMRYYEACQHCIEALLICPYRFDIYKCIVECHIQTNRLREAEANAIAACKQLNYSPHAYTLHASVLLKDPMASSKTVKKILEKALSLDKNSTTNALNLLVEFLLQEQSPEKAVQFLLAHIEHHPSSRAHQLLGDCYVHLHKYKEAFNYYTVALKLDPANQRATEGLSAVGRSSNFSSKRDSFYSCVGEASFASQGTAGSDQEADIESDTDPWNAGAHFD